jgi:hypothetical protein
MKNTTMRSAIILLLHLFCAHFVFAQKVTITDPGALYSTFTWDNDKQKTTLAKQVSENELNNILKHGTENGWPQGIASLDNRNKKREDMKKYTATQIAKVEDFCVLKIASAQNQYMPDDMRANYDFYFVISQSGVSGSALPAAAPASVAKKTTTTDMKEGDIDSLVLKLTIPSSLTGGANGAGIAYDPVRKLYYAAMAGNKEYGLVVFDAKGKVVESTTTMIDVRGIWYNPLTKNIEVNGYSESGIAHYTRNAKGIPTTVVVDHTGLNQPDENSCGTLNTAANKVMFLYVDDLGEYQLEKRNPTTYEKTETLALQTEDEIPFSASLNSTTAVYTGLPKAEIGVFDTESDGVYLLDWKTGIATTWLLLNPGVIGEDRFNFAYANKLFWFFDKEDREWKGYAMKLNK